VAAHGKTYHVGFLNPHCVQHDQRVVRHIGQTVSRWRRTAVADATIIKNETTKFAL
jgi:hypothetical protein